MHSCRELPQKEANPLEQSKCNLMAKQIFDKKYFEFLETYISQIFRITHTVPTSQGGKI